jgi:hypothetical protein
MPPYKVSYVHLDGNEYEVGEKPTLPEARALSRQWSEWFQFMGHRHPTLPVLVTDVDDPELGDLAYDPEED